MKHISKLIVIGLMLIAAPAWAARSLDGTQALGVGADTESGYFLNHAQADLVLWIRWTDEPPSSWAVAYHEIGSAKQVQIRASLASAGAIEGFILADGPDVSISHDGGYNDGEWHMVVLSRRSLTDTRLIIDGVERASSTNTTESITTGGNCNIGRRLDSDSNYFDGDVSDVAVFSGGNLTQQQIDELRLGTKHVKNVAPNLTLRQWMPLHEKQPIEQVAMSSYSVFIGTEGSLVDGPNGLLPVGMKRASFDKAYHWGQHTTTLYSPPSGEWFRELGNIIFTGKRYEHYATQYTGDEGSYLESTPMSISLATSQDAVSWTYVGKVIDSGVLSSEDPFVYYDQTTGVRHLYCENKTGGDNDSGIAYFTSSDGESWIRQDSDVSPALDKGAASSWEDKDVSSPVIVKHGSRYAMIYEGRKVGSADDSIGLATADSPAGPWTKYANNPIYSTGAGIVPDDAVKIGSYWYMAVHASGSSAPEILQATALEGPWTPIPTPSTNGRTAGTKSQNVMFWPGRHDLLITKNTDTAAMEAVAMAGDGVTAAASVLDADSLAAAVWAASARSLTDATQVRAELAAELARTLEQHTLTVPPVIYELLATGTADTPNITLNAKVDSGSLSWSVTMGDGGAGTVVDQVSTGDIHTMQIRYDSTADSYNPATVRADWTTDGVAQFAEDIIWFSQPVHIEANIGVVNAASDIQNAADAAIEQRLNGDPADRIAMAGATNTNLDQITAGTTQPRVNKDAGPGFQLELSNRRDGKHKCFPPARIRPGTVERPAISIDMSPIYGKFHVLNVGTPTVSSGSITATGLGPRDCKAMVELGGTATALEVVEVTVPVTMDTGGQGETIDVTFEIKVFAD